MLIYIASELTCMRPLKVEWIPDVDDPDGGYHTVNGQMMSTREEQARAMAGRIAKHITKPCALPVCVPCRVHREHIADVEAFINGGFGRE